jgi:hypothetical protein
MCILGPRLMLNLQEAYYKPFADSEEAREHISEELELHQEPVEGGTSREKEDGDTMDISYEESTVLSRSDLLYHRCACIM